MKLILFSCLLVQLVFGALDSNEQTILKDWFNSLTNKGVLNWDVDNDLCGQLGITCDSAKQRVTQITLPLGLFSGTLPTTFGELSKLTSLIMTNNGLTGTIPTELGQLNQLSTLNLAVTSLSGTIPTEIGQLVNLQSLQLSNNQLTGTIPTILGNLINLQILYLNNNQLSGTIPTVFGLLVKLQGLSIGSNQLSGTIPTILGNLIQLQSLNLAVTRFNGTIPTEFGKLVSLTEISLNNNQFGGTIPTEFGLLVKLQSLYLNNNNLVGAIPSNFGNLIQLQKLYLSYNQLSGTISTRLGNLSQVKYLDLSWNNLMGTLPTQLGNLNSIQTMILEENQLTGTIPSEYAKFKTLQTWSLSQNQLTGTIPSFIIDIGLDSLHLLNNNWDCPLFNYSSIRSSDFPHTETMDPCFEWCPSNTCLSGQTCSVRYLSNDHSCCSPGYIGTNCSNALYCSHIPNEENAEWDQTLANGQVAMGNCLGADYYGVISRVCYQDGSNGNWSSIFGSCTYVECTLPNHYVDIITLTCTPCPPGFSLDSSKTCQNINECLTNNGGCHENEYCTDTIGSYFCTCKKGMVCSSAMKSSFSFGLIASILLILLALFF